MKDMKRINAMEEAMRKASPAPTSRNAIVCLDPEMAERHQKLARVKIKDLPPCQMQHAGYLKCPEIEFAEGLPDEFA